MTARIWRPRADDHHFFFSRELLLLHVSKIGEVRTLWEFWRLFVPSWYLRMIYVLSLAEGVDPFRPSWLHVTCRWRGWEKDSSILPLSKVFYIFPLARAPCIGFLLDHEIVVCLFGSNTSFCCVWIQQNHINNFRLIWSKYLLGRYSYWPKCDACPWFLDGEIEMFVDCSLVSIDGTLIDIFLENSQSLYFLPSRRLFQGASSSYRRLFIPPAAIISCLPFPSLGLHGYLLGATCLGIRTPGFRLFGHQGLTEASRGSCRAIFVWCSMPMKMRSPHLSSYKKNT